MADPKIDAKAGSWLFSWEQPYPVAIRIDRARQHSDGRISAEITVTSGSEPMAQNGHLHHSIMSNLLGPRIRSDVVKALKERADSIEWADYLEIVCENVIIRLRQGEPVVPLIDVAFQPGSRWRLAPILHEGLPTILFGFGGSLKSYLAHLWAVRVALGIDCAAGNVLVLDWESTQEEWRERQHMICVGLGVAEPPNLYYRRCASPLVSDIEEILEMVGELDINLVIIDSAAYACGDEPERAGPVTDFFRALRSLHCTTLIVAHQSNDSSSRKPFGSIFWENAARSTIQVRRSEHSDSAVTVGLYNRKVNYGRPFQPFALTASFHLWTEEEFTIGDKVLFTAGKLAEVPDLAASGTASDRILSYLMEVDQPASSAEIEANAGVKGVRVVLKRMAENGLLSQDPGSRWLISTPSVTSVTPVT